MSSPTLVLPSQQTIPVAIVGLPEAGKTAFVRRLRGDPLGMLLRTVGIDAELYRQGELSFHLFDLGGGEAFQKVLWKHYIRAAAGIIFVVDGANPAQFPAAHKCFSKVIEWAKAGVPVLLLWNKMDSPGFIPYLELSKELHFKIPEKKEVLPITVVQISALQDLKVKKAFGWLAQQIQNNIMSKPAKIQALRVYSRHPEIILTQIGETDVFEILLELCISRLQPNAINLKYASLNGGNYLVSCSSELCFCIAIFHNETPWKVGQKFAEEALRIVESKIRESGRPFPLLSPDMESIIEYFGNSQIQTGALP